MTHRFVAAPRPLRAGPSLGFAAIMAAVALLAAAAQVPASAAPSTGTARSNAARVVATPPVRLTPAEADSLEKAITSERMDDEEWLKSSPTSYLATVSRVDFGAKTSLTVGTEGDNDVRLQAPDVLPHHLRVSVIGDVFDVRGMDPGATFKTRGRDTTAAVLEPSPIQVGRFTLRLSHQRFPALIVFDPKSPRYALYKGLAHYPVDFRWRFVAPLTPNPAPDTTIIQSTRGNLRRAVRVGWFDLRMAGRAVRLEAHRLLEPGVGENDMSLFFRDATTGKETYAVGRYLEPERLPDGRFLLDFNSAYNPACAFSDHYNCPIPSKANTLPVAVTAGEKDSHYVH